MPQDNFMIAQLHELLSYLSNRGVTTFMVVAQSGMLGTMTSSIEASYLADSVVLLRYFEHNGAIKKAISVMKKRTGGHEEAIRQLTFSSRGIHVGDPLLQLRGVLTGVPVETGVSASAGPVSPRAG
jgi:circadian clock protein KaiC